MSYDYMKRRELAEAQGFEPWEGFHPRRFSRPVHSTTLPSLRSPTLLMCQSRFGKWANAFTFVLFSNAPCAGNFADLAQAAFSGGVMQDRVRKSPS